MLGWLPLIEDARKNFGGAEKLLGDLGVARLGIEPGLSRGRLDHETADSARAAGW